MIKRIYDISACSNTAVTVYYNNKKIKQKTFLQYANLYTNNEDIVKIHEIVNDRWEIIACLNQNDVFSHVSFVNGISTIHGTHVNYIQDQIVKKLSAIIKKRKLDTVIKNSFIKNKLRLFIKCFIENPIFGSQSKQELKSKVKSYGSTVKISDKFIKQLTSKTNIIDEIVQFANYKETRNLKKQMVKRRKI